MSLEDLIQRCRHHPVLQPLAARLATNGTPLYAVGGPVRDALDDVPVADLDVATAAAPDTIAQLGHDLGTLDLVGAPFGVIRIVSSHAAIDVATFRTERYDDRSRNPTVELVADLTTDLRRRDFTINAMALRLDDATLHDPYGGREALRERLLDTPSDPVQSFRDDPLRIHRAWRLAATRRLTPALRVVEAAHTCNHRLDLITRERSTAELLKVVEDPADVLADAVEIMCRLHAQGHALPGAEPPDADTLRGVPAGMARLAALTRHTTDPDRTLRAWKIDNDRRRRVVDVHQIIDALTTPDVVGVRRMVRLHDDDQLDTAAVLWQLNGNSPHAALVHAREDAARWRQPLAVTGSDLLAHHRREAGPWIGQALRDLEDHLLRTGQNVSPAQLT